MTTSEEKLGLTFRLRVWVVQVRYDDQEDGIWMFPSAADRDKYLVDLANEEFFGYRQFNGVLGSITTRQWEALSDDEKIARYKESQENPPILWDTYIDADASQLEPVP